MQSLDIAQSDTTTLSNMQKVGGYKYNARLFLILFTVSLGYISVGYHLSVFNTVSIFLWQGIQWEYEYYTFQNICDTILALGTFFAAFLIALNKIRFEDYRKVFMLTDIAMIFGTLCSLGVFSSDSTFIFWGRFVCAEAIALNITCIVSFAREAQFYSSQSNFKTEQRRFFGEVFFALGVFLGLMPPKVITELQEYQGYSEEEDDSISYVERNLAINILISLIPVIVSLTRIGLLAFLGKITCPEYAPTFTDEGLCENEEIELANTAAYMFKFKEIKAVLKLFEYPFKKRLEICYILYFIQASTGFSLFIVNPLFVANYLRDLNKDDPDYQDVQATAFEFTLVFLLAAIVTNVLFLLYKIPRKLFMYTGVASACLFSFLLLIFMMGLSFQHLWILLLLYWTSVCIGMGSAVELHIEELIPAKGLQFLQSIKWLIIALLGVMGRYVLTNNFSFVIAYMFYFGLNILAMFVVHELTFETAGLSLQEIQETFAVQEQQDLPEGMGDFDLVRSVENSKIEHEANNKIELNEENETRSSASSRISG